MTCKVQVVTVTESGEEVVRDVACVERHELTPASLGLAIADSKAILQGLQEVVVEWQMRTYLDTQRHCPHCDKLRQSKGGHHTVFRTVFGDLPVESPRFTHCPCQEQDTASYSPLAALLPEHTTPELLYLETKWASLASYGITVKLLQDVLPFDEPLEAVTIRNHLCTLAERLEEELGEEQGSLIEGCPRDWGELPTPDGPLTVGIDGGYVKAQGMEQGWFEVIAGKSILAFRRGEDHPTPSSKCFAFVQTYDQKPQRRLFEVLQSQGLQMNQQIEFLSDGGDTVREVQLYLSPEAEHLLDWFHLAMRFTTMTQSAKGLPETMGDEQPLPLRDEVIRQLERTKWFLWHGNVFRALHVLTTILFDLEMAAGEHEAGKSGKLWQVVQEFYTFIDRNRAFIPGNDVSIFLFRFELRGNGIHFVLNEAIAVDMYPDVDKKLKPLAHACCETLLRHRHLSVSNTIMDGNILATGEFEVMLSKGLGRHVAETEKQQLFQDAKNIADLLVAVMERKTQELTEGERQRPSHMHSPQRPKQRKKGLEELGQAKRLQAEWTWLEEGQHVSPGLQQLRPEDLPPGVRASRGYDHRGHCVTFAHETFGELGKIVLVNIRDGKTLIQAEIYKGQEKEDSPLVQKKKDVFGKIVATVHKALNDNFSG